MIGDAYIKTELIGCSINGYHQISSKSLVGKRYAKARDMMTLEVTLEVTLGSVRLRAVDVVRVRRYEVTTHVLGFLSCVAHL